MSRKIEQFGVANLYPDNQPPIISFFKGVAIEVELDNGDDFTFTPQVITRTENRKKGNKLPSPDLYTANEQDRSDMIDKNWDTKQTSKVKIYIPNMHKKLMENN